MHILPEGVAPPDALWLSCGLVAFSPASRQAAGKDVSTRTHASLLLICLQHSGDLWTFPFGDSVFSLCPYISIPVGACGGAELLTLWPQSEREQEEGAGSTIPFKSMLPVTQRPPTRSHHLPIVSPWRAHRYHMAIWEGHLRSKLSHQIPSFAFTITVHHFLFQMSLVNHSDM